MKTNLIEKWRSIETEDVFLTKDLAKKDKLIADSFEKNIEFGTAGIRGVMGAGTDKMNIHTVAAAAQAYADYLKSVKGSKKMNGVIIGHDNRHNSVLFSRTVADVLLNNGIQSYLFQENKLQPTPLVSYVIRKMKLSGGVIITASHNPKEYNGFKAYNNLGGQLLPSETKKIQNYMSKIDSLSINISHNEKCKFLDEKIITQYKHDIYNTVQLRSDDKTIKVAFTPLHGTTYKIIPEVLEELGYEHYEVDKQMMNDPNFSSVKSPNPEDGRAFIKAISLARRTKSDLVIATDPDGDRIGAAVKYQRRYKFLNGNQMAALYLQYKLEQLKTNGGIPKDSYIIKSIVSGDLGKRIAEKYGVKVIETHVGFKNIAEVMNREKGNFIMAYEESYGFVFDKNIARDKDSVQGIVGLAEMVNYYKSQNTNAYSKLKELYKMFGANRTIISSRKLDIAATNRLFKRIKKWKNIGGKKISEIIDFRSGAKGLEPQQLIKVILEGGSWLAIRPSGTEPKVKVYVETFGSSTSSPVDIVIFEKEVLDKIADESETFVDKSFSWKTVLKYTVFIAILVGIMYFVFTTIYASATSSSSSIWDQFNKVVHLKNKSILLILVGAMLFNMFLDILMRWKLLKHHGQKVKIRDLLVSSVMGTFISYVTPLTIGGDAIGYWYMRRRGFKRAPLISTYLTMTILWQMKNIVLTLILVPMGLFMFKDYFFSGDPQMVSIMIMFIVGFFWDIFSTFMIWMLTFNKKFQEFIVRNSIKFLEWIPLIHLSDPTAKAAGPKYEFLQLRTGMKHIWKRKRLIAELMVYETIPKLFAIAAFLPMGLGIMKSGLTFGEYWSQIVTTDVINTANSLALTPGSAGFGEFISINLNQEIYVGGTGTAAALDLVNKIIWGWPFLLVSVMSIIIVIGGEKRRVKYEIQNKNNILKGKKTNYKTGWYLKTSWVWAILLGGWVTLLVLI